MRDKCLVRDLACNLRKSVPEQHSHISEHRERGGAAGRRHAAVSARRAALVSRRLQNKDPLIDRVMCAPAGDRWGPEAAQGDCGGWGICVNGLWVRGVLG